MTAVQQDGLAFPEWPRYDDEERVALMRALEQGQWWRMGGGEVDAFDREFAAHEGAPHALAVTTGTHALELALQVLGAGPGTEVIVPAFTFISSSQAAQRLGAIAVPVDVDPGSYCLDPAAVEAAVTDRTRVIMPVHMAGLVADMDAIAKIADAAGVSILHDAAHAQGAQWRQRPVGGLGSLAAYSFQNAKLMTAGEGGSITFPDQDSYDEAFVRHSCGRARDYRGYLHRVSGSNFRMNEFTAAVLRAQLTRLDAQIQVRAVRWALLSRLFADIPGVVPQADDARCTRNPRYMAMFRVPGLDEAGRDAVVATLLDHGVPAARAFRPVYQSAAFWEKAAPDTTVEALAARCQVSEALSRDAIWLHHRVLLADEPVLHRLAEVLADAIVASGDAR